MKLHLKRAIILIGIAVILLGLVSCYNVRTYYLIEMDGMKTEELCELLNFTVEEVRGSHPNLLTVTAAPLSIRTPATLNLKANTKRVKAHTKALQA